LNLAATFAPRRAHLARIQLARLACRRCTRKSGANHADRPSFAITHRDDDRDGLIASLASGRIVRKFRRRAPLDSRFRRCAALLSPADGVRRGSDAVADPPWWNVGCCARWFRVSYTREYGRRYADGRVRPTTTTTLRGRDVNAYVCHSPLPLIASDSRSIVDSARRCALNIARVAAAIMTRERPIRCRCR